MAGAAEGSGAQRLPLYCLALLGGSPAALCAGVSLFSVASGADAAGSACLVDGESRDVWKKRDGAASVSAGATVIAAGARVKGELQVEGDLEVRGHVNGTIQLTGGVLRIMQGGTVEGDVSAPHVIINGLLEGTCTSAEVEILESGKMQGIFKGGSLSICKGGNFVGQSQPTVAGKADPVLQALSENRSPENKQPENKNNVKKLPHEPKGKATEELAKQA